MAQGWESQTRGVEVAEMEIESGAGPNASVPSGPIAGDSQAQGALPAVAPEAGEAGDGACAVRCVSE